MWPPLNVASRTSDVANIFLIASLIVGVISTFVIVRMGTVKEAYWDADRLSSQEKVASLELEIAEANRLTG